MRFFFISLVFINIFSIASAKTNNMQFTQRIIGGVNATENQVPFIVSLRKYGQHFCGGSLVKENWVVTAAHCIDGAGDPDQVLVGSLKVSGKGSQKMSVEEVFVHPNYNKETSGSDFALVKLKSKVNVDFAELNTEDPSVNTVKQYSVAGWGVLDENGYSSPSDLQIVDVPYVEQNKCEQQFQKFESSETPYLDNTMFCAGYDAGEKDACQGDSGGPIFYKDQTSQKFILVGIVSWGYGCARKDLSGVYSNIATESSWINKTIQNN